MKKFLVIAAFLVAWGGVWAGDVVEDFGNTSNPAGWTWGTPVNIVPTGGNPRGYLNSGVLDTFAPQLRTTQPSPFTGDYRAQGVSSIGVDLVTFSALSTGGRPLAPMLIYDGGTPGDFSDDTAAYTLLDNIPDVGDGWLSYDVAVDSQSTALPAGWFLLNLGDVGAPPIHTWDEVIQNVTRLQYFYGNPDFVFIFQQWEIGADNIRITTGGGTGGGLVQVTITGQVVFNGISDPPLGDVNSGQDVVMTFTVDPENFQEGVPGDTRGYVIDQDSFSLTFGGTTALDLLEPFPGTPFFTIVEGFPVSDGFFVSTFPTSPGGVPLEQEPFNANFSVGYTGDTLESLDILDNLGTYGFGGLTNFGFNLWAVSPDNVAMEIDFEQLVIEETGGPDPVPATSPVGLIVLTLIVMTIGTFVLRRRSSTT